MDYFESAGIFSGSLMFFWICPGSLEFSRIFLDSVRLFRLFSIFWFSFRFFRILPDSLESSQNLVAFFLILNYLLEIGLDSFVFFSYFSRSWIFSDIILCILLDSSLSSRNIVGFCRILSDSFRIFSDSVEFS